MQVKRILFGLVVEYDSDVINDFYTNDIRVQMHNKISEARNMFYDILSYDVLGFDRFVVLPRILALLKLPISLIGDIFDISATIVDDVIDFEIGNSQKSLDKIKNFDDFILNRLQQSQIVATRKKFRKRIEKAVEEIKNNNTVNDAYEFMKPFIKYNSRFFKGEFVDRNGTSLVVEKEDLKALLEQGKDIANNIRKGKDTSIKLDETSGELFSQLISVIFEFIMDSLLEVPFYCREIAEANNVKDKTTSQKEDLETQMTTLETSLKDLDMGKLPSRAQRLDLIKLQGLDEKYANTISNETTLDKLMTPDTKVFQKLADKYACYASGVITDPIQQIHFACVDDAGEKTDYAVLVGELTSQLSIKAGSAAKSGLASAIKGGSVFSTNNETITEAVATIGGVVTKKICEFAVYQLARKIITDKNIFNRELALFGKTITKRYLIKELEEIYVN